MRSRKRQTPAHLLLRPKIRQLTAHLVEMNQGPVDHSLAGADLDRRHRGVGAVAALGRRLDGRKILLIVIAITQEEDVFQPGPSLQAESVPAEELAGDADETEATV